MEKTLENYFLFIRNGVSIKQFDGDGIPITRIESISNEYLNFSKLGFANIYDENYKEYYLKNGALHLYSFFQNDYIYSNQNASNQ